jgi:flavin reductase (DIM6/NTAB) family NADH-FMN oxidoreductase RutF
MTASIREESPMTDALDPRELRRAFGMFPSGVTGVCALVDGDPVGLTASSFTSVSLDPPLVSVCVALTSSTWRLLRSADRIGVSVLGAGDGQLARQLASRVPDRFAGVDYTVVDDAVLLPGAALGAVCSVEQEVTAGDHIIAVLRVHSVDPHPDVVPLVFHGSEFPGLNIPEPPWKSWFDLG